MMLSQFVRMLAVAALVALVGCAPEEEGGAPKIALIMKAISNPFFQTMADGATSAAAELQINLTTLSVPRETDFDEQAKHVENMIAQSMDAIVIAPADSKAIVSPLLEAQRKGIHIINIDNRIDTATAQQEGLKVLTFIGPDNAEGAEKSTDYLIQVIGGKGQVVMLEGIRGVNNAEQRKAGFLRAVAKTNGAVTVAGMDTANWAQDQGQEKMAALLTRFPNGAGVFCANDNMALGAIAAIESAGKTGQVHVTAYDNLESARQAILEGKIDATIEQHPFKMGYMGVEYALKAIRGETFPNEIRVPTDLITAETIRADMKRAQENQSE